MTPSVPGQPAEPRPRLSTLLSSGYVGRCSHVEAEPLLRTAVSCRKGPPKEHPTGKCRQQRPRAAGHKIVAMLCREKSRFDRKIFLQSFSFAKKYQRGERTSPSSWATHQNLRVLRFSKAQTCGNRPNCSLLPLARSVVANGMLCL